MAEPSIDDQDDSGTAGETDTGGTTNLGNSVFVIHSSVNIRELLEKAKIARANGTYVNLLSKEQQDSINAFLTGKSDTKDDKEASPVTSFLTYGLIAGLLFVILKPKQKKNANG